MISQLQSAKDDTYPARVIAISSGKGGVGKTTVSANLAIAFAQEGGRVLAMDADLGLANLDICFGVSPVLTLLDLLDESAHIDDILCEVAEGVMLLPSCSGQYELANMGQKERYRLFSAIDLLEDRFDVLLLDTGAGIGSNAVSFAGAASEVVLVTNPDPAALADAYGFIKVLSGETGVKRFNIIANMVANAAEGEEVYRRLLELSDRFLKVGLGYLGFIPRDTSVSKAVRCGRPLLIEKPNAPASRCIKRVATRILNSPQNNHGASGIKLFWKRIVGLKEAS